MFSIIYSNLALSDGWCHEQQCRGSRRELGISWKEAAKITRAGGDLLVSIHSLLLYFDCVPMSQAAITKYLGPPQKALQSFGCYSNFYLLNRDLSCHLWVNLGVCSQEQWKKFWVMQLSEGDIHFKSRYWKEKSRIWRKIFMQWEWKREKILLKRLLFFHMKKL